MAIVSSCATVSHGRDSKPVAVLEDHQHPRHKNNIVDIIGKNDAQVYLTTVNNNNKYINTLRRISYSKAKIVNLSLQSCTYDIKERALIEQMIADGKVVVVASGNPDWKKENNCKAIYPASYKLKGLIVAGYKGGVQDNVDIISSGKHCTSSFDCMYGSSQSAAQVSRQILELMKKDIHRSVIVDIIDRK